ncbi:hypothetical protein IT157_08520 [bacterium]|nr:hypothetical protein [bacterium]
MPPLLLRLSVAASGLLPLALLVKGGELEILPLLIALALGAAAYLGWLWSPSQNGTADGASSRPWIAVSLIAAVAGAIAVIALHENLRAHAFWPLLPFLFYVAYEKIGRRSLMLRHVLVPLLFASGIMFTSSIVGRPELGAFPAAIAVLFVSVLRFTLDIEEDVFENHAGQDGLEVQHHYRSRPAVAAIIFFLFGTVSLWPWLGTIYGQGYFWVMLCGVLFPLVFFWGRIRQPNMEGAHTALIRFNRVAPILGFIHILAILIA